ncbi:hypothetical protein PsorP6_005940 [Peronosclerospora sorghi]|uniref:Uncharacterized protein n=1 Tax=Peronosclerospora sorghi TaxID=230839 RepID=A0ACC0W637_9STRA|nr:hypothetical protein PsorP6_005940 [Peronosclerospora sorghi]
MAVQKVKKGVFALFNCCFPPSNSPEPTIEDLYIVQEQFKRRSTNAGDDLANGIFSNYQNPPRWIKDDFIEACVLCNVQFDPIKRKHHCRSCGLIFCRHCAATFYRLVKFGFLKPVRLCHICASTAESENVFFEKRLPLLEGGDLFSKYGLLRKRYVYLKFLRAKNMFQYQNINPETRKFEGDIKVIALDEITDVREVALGQDNADLRIIITVGQQKHRFDAPTPHKKQEWIKAIVTARQARDKLLAVEREKRVKQVEKENVDIRMMSENLQMMEKRRGIFHEDRMCRRGEKREQLRTW